MVLKKQKITFCAHFLREKKGICLLTPHKQIPFLTISEENIFFKTQGTRLRAMVALNKGLE